jgi:tripeptidyl-peptidase-1
MKSVGVVAALLTAVCAQERAVLESDVTVFEAPHWTREGRALKTETVTPTFMLRHTAEAKAEFEKVFYDVSTPGNPRYGQHLTRAEIAEMLTLVPGAKENIISMLASHGVTDVEIFDDMIKAPMSVEVAEKIFAAEIFEYKHETGMKLLRVGSQYSLPTEVSGLVYNVADLIQLPSVDQPNLAEIEQDANAAAFPTCASGKCGATSVTPPVLAAQYNFDLNYEQETAGGGAGAKTTVAVAAFQGQSWDTTDLNDFAQACDVADVEVADQVGPNTASECLIPLIGANLCLEALLDVQYVKSTAGNIPLTVISNSQYSLASWAQELMNMADVPPIQSVSYGNDEIQQTSSSYMESVNVQFQKLGAMGVSVLFASGDQGVVGRTGVTSDGRYHPDFPAASPYVTAVGGTDLLEKSVIGAEKAWSDGGGGFSDEFDMPAYQKDAVTSYLQKLAASGEAPPASAFNSAGRGYPDVSALAGTQNPYCVAADRQFVGVGGTSASCPTTAGMFARINAERTAQGKPVMGFLNPFIYQNADAFNDVTSGSNPGATGVKGFTALPGWDAATGVGTPDFQKVLAAALKATETSVIV